MHAPPPVQMRLWVGKVAKECKTDGGGDAVQRDDPAPLSKLRVEQIVDDGDGTPQPVVPLHGDLVE